MSSESEFEGEHAKAKKLWWRKRWLVTLVAVATAWVAFGVVVGSNAFGRNISGTVICANGDVMGVFVEAERAPRSLGMELQSGFAGWEQMSSSRSATFYHWLPYGGDYTLHVGCGILQRPGARLDWATNNHTPLIRETVTNWVCDSPVNTTMVTITGVTCRSRS